MSSFDNNYELFNLKCNTEEYKNISLKMVISKILVQVENYLEYLVSKCKFYIIINNIHYDNNDIKNNVKLFTILIFMDFFIRPEIEFEVKDKNGFFNHKKYIGLFFFKIVQKDIIKCIENKNIFSKILFIFNEEWNIGILNNLFNSNSEQNISNACKYIIDNYYIFFNNFIKSNKIVVNSFGLNIEIYYDILNSIDNDFKECTEALLSLSSKRKYYEI